LHGQGQSLPPGAGEGGPGGVLGFLADSLPEPVLLVGWNELARLLEGRLGTIFDQSGYLARRKAPTLWCSDRHVADPLRSWMLRGADSMARLKEPVRGAGPTYPASVGLPADTLGGVPFPRHTEGKYKSHTSGTMSLQRQGQSVPGTGRPGVFFPFSFYFLLLCMLVGFHGKACSQELERMRQGKL